MRRRGLGGIVLLLLLGRALHSHACTWAWDAPASNTDGSPVTNLAGYRLYRQPPNTATPTLVGEVGPVTSVTLDGPCQVGTYWVTAFSTLGVESEPSESVIVLRPGKPPRLTITK